MTRPQRSRNSYLASGRINWQSHTRVAGQYLEELEMSFLTAKKPPKKPKTPQTLSHICSKVQKYIHNIALFIRGK